MFFCTYISMHFSVYKIYKYSWWLFHAGLLIHVWLLMWHLRGHCSWLCLGWWRASVQKTLYEIIWYIGVLQCASCIFHHFDITKVSNARKGRSKPLIAFLVISQRNLWNVAAGTLRTIYVVSGKGFQRPAQDLINNGATHGHVSSQSLSASPLHHLQIVHKKKKAGK